MAFLPLRFCKGPGLPRLFFSARFGGGIAHPEIFRMVKRNNLAHHRFRVHTHTHPHTHTHTHTHTHRHQGRNLGAWVTSSPVSRTEKARRRSVDP